MTLMIEFTKTMQNDDLIGFMSFFENIEKREEFRNVLKKKNSSFLIEAIESDSTKIFEYLLKVGENFEELNTDGETIIFSCIRNRKLEFTRLLIAFGCDMNKRNIYGKSLRNVLSEKTAKIGDKHEKEFIEIILTHTDR